MAQIQPPPIYDFLSDDEGKTNLSWILFFNSLYEGDTGTEWIPTFQNLTEVGTPTIVGRYYRIARRICYFAISITPSTSTTSTAGTTYIDNFPLNPVRDGVCFAVSGGVGAVPGHIVSGTNRIYVPAWSAVTVPLTVIGLVEVST